MPDSQFSSCSSVNLKDINIVFCGTAATCCLVSAIILFLIVTHKEYYTVLQRLFLYLMVAVFIRELFMAASFEHQFQYDPVVQNKVCSGIGFGKNWAGILLFVFTVGMKVYLLLYVNNLTRGNKGPMILYSKRCRVILEILLVVLTIVITLVYASVPFYTNNYGLAGPWCWIRVLNANCTVSTSGMINQMLNGYIFYVSGSVIGLILLIATVVLYCRLPMAYNNEAARMLLKKTFCVIVTFLVNIVMMVLALITRVFAAKDKQYNLPGLWYSFGITFPTSLLLFPIVYMICFFRLNMCGLCRPHHNDHADHRPFPSGHSIEKPTIRSSSRFSAPSVTQFEPPYTDAFTDSRVLESDRLINNNSIAKEATGYGSINTAGNTSTDSTEPAGHGSLISPDIHN